MFNADNMFKVFCVSMFIFFAASFYDGHIVTLASGNSFQLQLTSIALCAFVAALFSAVMLAIGFVVLSGIRFGILCGWTNEELDPGYTRSELIEHDREEEPHWNATQRETALSVGQEARYTDYQGYIREAGTNEVVAYDMQRDQRNVQGNKVSDFYERGADGLWHIKSLHGGK